MLSFRSAVLHFPLFYSFEGPQDGFIPFWVNYSFDNSAVLLFSLIVRAIVSDGLFVADGKAMRATAVELNSPDYFAIGEWIYFILLFNLRSLNFFLSDHKTNILKFSCYIYRIYLHI